MVSSETMSSREIVGKNSGKPTEQAAGATELISPPTKCQEATSTATSCRNYLSDRTGWSQRGGWWHTKKTGSPSDHGEKPNKIQKGSKERGGPWWQWLQLKNLSPGSMKDRNSFNWQVRSFRQTKRDGQKEARAGWIVAQAGPSLQPATQGRTLEPTLKKQTLRENPTEWESTWIKSILDLQQSKRRAGFFWKKAREKIF